MRRRLQTLPVIVILLAALCAPVFAATEKPSEETLAWCKERGVVCLSASEYQEVATRIIVLERDLKIAHARSLRRLGWSIGPVFAVTYDERVAIGLGATWGFRF